MNDQIVQEIYQSVVNGTNKTLITKMSSGFLLMGYQQFFPGYVLLFADPQVSSLNEMTIEQRTHFLRDMSIAGDALLKCTKAYRINYEILGNETAVLHAHIFPRYLHEKDEFRKGPVWLYDEKAFNSVMFDAVNDQTLLKCIKTAIETEK